MPSDREWHNQYYQRRRKRAIDYLGGKCINCKATESLQFDHDDASTKSYPIARNLNRRWEVLKVELDKCVLRCEPCHKAKTRAHKDQRGGQNKWTSIRHGTLHAYGKYKCRCEPCKEAKRASRKPKPL